jgi:non-ribosomal peptide synthetase component E (peptide arylation enzyme)
MVIPREGAALTPEQLKQYALDKGPAYAHPRFIEFVSHLPLSGAGKIDRAEVQRRLQRAGSLAT